MTEPEREGKDSGSPADIRTDIPHPARVYDYWLGGTDNFPADREMAGWVLTVTPETLDTVRANRPGVSSRQTGRASPATGSRLSRRQKALACSFAQGPAGPTYTVAESSVVSCTADGFAGLCAP